MIAIYYNKLQQYYLSKNFAFQSNNKILKINNIRKLI